MYLLGILAYIALPIAAVMLDSSAAFIDHTFMLAPEIATMITIVYFYPLVIFLLGRIFKKTRMATRTYFKSQAILASTLAVSFGLIGTFIGLADMIGGIAAGMGAEGDFSTKMNSLLTSISTALDAMSFAFLTSILGIGASSSILLCANFMFSYYKEEDEEKLNGSEPTANDVVTRIEESIQKSLDLIAQKEKVWSDLYLLLEKSVGSNVVDNLNQTLQQNSSVTTDVALEIKGMRQDNTQLFSENNFNLATQTEKVTGEMHIMREDYARLFSESNENAVVQAGHVTGEMKILREEHARLVAENNSNVVAQAGHMTGEMKILREEHARLVAENNSNTVAQADHVIGEMKLLREEHARLVAENNNAMSGYSEQVSSSVASSIGSLENMEYAIDGMKIESNANTNSITHVISKNVTRLEAISNLIESFSVALAPPVHEVLEKAITDDLLNLCFQAQKNVDGQFIGAETFVFWEDAIRGKISNVELFKQAEKHGLLERLDAWIMDSTFKNLAGWVEKGKWEEEATLSINVSTAYFVSPTFVSDLNRLLTKHAVSPSLIALEITEEALMTHPELCQDKIGQIRNLGVKLYVDDFGTGYTSMKNLKMLNVDMLKIDRTIVKSILDGNEGESVIRSIVSMASELGIKVAAEGIELQEQVDKLIELGCTVFQGYYLGQPTEKQNFQEQYIFN